MVTYTNDDIDGSTKFSEVNLIIRFIQKMHAKAPHLISWADYRIRDATQDDYYIPATLQHACKVIETDMTKTLCDLLSCTPSKEQDVCDPQEKASYYYVGDDAYDVQCQPACYNTLPVVHYNEDGTRAADMPMLNFHNGKCRILNTHTISFLEKPFYRSTTKYETRVNDMPTGFSRIASDNPYGGGITYRTNSTYCDYYDRHIQEDGSCQMTIPERIAGSLIGEMVINVVKSSIRMLSNSHVPFKLPENLPPLPTKLKDVHTVEGWKQNINRDFVVPTLIDTKPRMVTRKKRSTTPERYTNDDAKNILIHRRRMAELDNDNISDFTRLHMGMSVNEDTQKNRGKRDIPSLLKDINASKAKIEGEIRDKTDDERAHNMFYKLFASIMHLPFDENVYIMGGTQYVAYQLLKNLEPLILKITEKMSTLMYDGLASIIGSLGERVLYDGIRAMTINAAVSTTISIGSETAIFLAKVLGSAASIVGWVLMVSMAFDLIFSFWDPYGYKKLFPPTQTQDIIDKGELAIRQHVKRASFDFEFDMLVRSILTEDEILEIQIQSLTDRLVYLDALVVNSEGSRIDKGQPLNVSTIGRDNLTVASQRGITERVKWDNTKYARYNEKFLDRVRFNKYGNYTALVMMIVTMILAISPLKMLALFFLVLTVIVLALVRYEVYDDLFVDLMHKYTNKQNMIGAFLGFKI